MREGQRFPASFRPAAAVQQAPAARELEGETPQTAGSGSLGSPPARLLQLVGPLGCCRLPAPGASSPTPSPVPRLPALAVEGTGGGRADGNVWESRRVLILRTSPETASRVPFPTPAQV